jgi:hypothetical protein
MPGDLTPGMAAVIKLHRPSAKNVLDVGRFFVCVWQNLQ